MASPKTAFIFYKIVDNKFIYLPFKHLNQKNMSTTVTRKYKTKDVEMLTATATIIENAIANKTLLQSKRTTWADTFFDDLKTQIQSTTDTYL